jgi:hypothetical protein
MLTQSDAKNRIDALHGLHPDRLTAAYAARAKALIDNPDLVDQGYYAICGPIAALRVLLTCHLDKFIELTEAVFKTDPPMFNGIKRVDPANLLPARRREIAAKSALYPSPPDPNAYSDRADFDFILGASLNTFLHRIDAATYIAQRSYSESLVPMVGVSAGQAVLATFSGDLTSLLDDHGSDRSKLAGIVGLYADEIARKLGYKIDTLRIGAIRELVPHTAWAVTFPTDSGDKEFVFSRNDVTHDFQMEAMVVGETGGVGFATGDLGLDQDGLAMVMVKVLGFPASRFVKRMDAKTDVQATKNLPVAGSFVLGLVKGYAEWKTAYQDPTKRTFDSRRAPVTVVGRPTPDVEHHLVILGVAKNADGYVHVTVWSWTARFTVRIAPHLMNDYIHGYLYGQVPA